MLTPALSLLMAEYTALMARPAALCHRVHYSRRVGMPIKLNLTVTYRDINHSTSYLVQVYEDSYDVAHKDKPIWTCAIFR